MWSTLSDSESVHLHWDAASAILNGRLWVFGGRRHLGNNVAYNQVESYDLDKAVWQLQKDAPADMNRFMFNAVPITKTSKVRKLN